MRRAGVAFPAFAAVAVAGLDDLPTTIESRALVRMRRRATDAQVEPYRLRRREPRAWAIGERLADVLDGLSLVDEPDLPDGVVDRSADVWEPLLAIAQTVGIDRTLPAGASDRCDNPPWCWDVHPTPPCEPATVRPSRRRCHVCVERIAQLRLRVGLHCLAHRQAVAANGSSCRGPRSSTCDPRQGALYGTLPRWTGLCFASRLAAPQPPGCRVGEDTAPDRDPRAVLPAAIDRGHLRRATGRDAAPLYPNFGFTRTR